MWRLTSCFFDGRTWHHFYGAMVLFQVGGILGLCVGVSLISVVEIVYWAVVGVVQKSLTTKRRNVEEGRRKITVEEVVG